MHDASIYNRLLKISRAYLGPATERFIDRQVRNHLKKEPVDVTGKDIFKLLDWLRTSMSLLTEDRKTIDEYIGKLQRLANEAEGT